MKNNSILLSIKPYFAYKIFTGEKRIELRRKLPKNLQKGDLVLVYASSPEKNIYGAFTIKKIISFPPDQLWKKTYKKSSIEKQDFETYFSGTKIGYGIEIDKYWSFPNPISLNDIKDYDTSFNIPQSFRYLKDSDFNLIKSEFGAILGAV